MPLKSQEIVDQVNGNNDNAGFGAGIHATGYGGQLLVTAPGFDPSEFDVSIDDSSSSSSSSSSSTSTSTTDEPTTLPAAPEGEAYLVFPRSIDSLLDSNDVKFTGLGNYVGGGIALASGDYTNDRLPELFFGDPENDRVVVVSGRTSWPAQMSLHSANHSMGVFVLQGEPDSRFGFSIATCPQGVAIGAPNANTQAGQTFYIQNANASWWQQSHNHEEIKTVSVRFNGGASYHNSGFALALTEQCHLIIGEPGVSKAVDFRVGQTKYVINPGNWSANMSGPIGIIFQGRNIFDESGSQVFALPGGGFAIGAPKADPNGDQSGQLDVIMNADHIADLPEIVSLDDLDNRSIIFKGAAANDAVGTSMSAWKSDDNTSYISIGVPGANQHAGCVYTFALEDLPEVLTLSPQVLNESDINASVFFAGDAFGRMGTCVTPIRDFFGNHSLALAAGAPGAGDTNIGSVFFNLLLPGDNASTPVFDASSSTSTVSVIGFSSTGSPPLSPSVSPTKGSVSPSVVPTTLESMPPSGSPTEHSSAMITSTSTSRIFQNLPPEFLKNQFAINQAACVWLKPPHLNVTDDHTPWSDIEIYVVNVTHGHVQFSNGTVTTGFFQSTGNEVQFCQDGSPNEPELLLQAEDNLGQRSNISRTNITLSLISSGGGGVNIVFIILGAVGVAFLLLMVGFLYNRNQKQSLYQKIDKANFTAPNDQKQAIIAAAKDTYKQLLLAGFLNHDHSQVQAYVNAIAEIFTQVDSDSTYKFADLGKNLQPIMVKEVAKSIRETLLVNSYCVGWFSKPNITPERLTSQKAQVVASIKGGLAKARGVNAAIVTHNPTFQAVMQM